MTVNPSADALGAQVARLEHALGAYRPADALVRVSGDDRLTWLQGQITQDVLGLRPGASAYGLLLHPTGKIMADLDVLCRADDLVLVCAAQVVDEVLAQLDRYIMMEDVELARMTQPLVALQGPAAPALRDALAAELGDAQVFAVDRLGAGGLLVLQELGDALPNAVVAAGGDWVSPEAVTLARLRAGRPALGADFGPSVLPQVAGLTQRAVSFQKGCYRGQEPVVMLEHRGTPPKRLVRLRIEASAAPDAGATLRDASGAPIGTVTSAARAPDGVVYALGLLKRGAELESVTHVGDEADRAPARAEEFVA